MPLADLLGLAELVEPLHAICGQDVDQLIASASLIVLEEHD
ncbi:hypothetical protein ACFSTC_00050 [Nonomuraea ferruginea]